MEQLVASFRSLRPITDPEAEVITSFFIPGHFKEGDYLFEGGNVCDEYFFITEGVLRIVACNEKGVDVTHYFMSEGQFCTILQSFNNGTVAEDGIQACCPVTVLSITKKKLMELYAKLPFMTDLINQVNQQRMLEKIRLKNAYAGVDASSRYKVFLTEQASIINRVPLNYVASYLNVTPQSLSRIRRELI